MAGHRKRPASLVPPSPRAVLDKFSKAALMEILWDLVRAEPYITGDQDALITILRRGETLRAARQEQEQADLAFHEQERAAYGKAL